MIAPGVVLPAGRVKPPTIPVVFTLSPHPVSATVVGSRPGGAAAGAGHMHRLVLTFDDRDGNVQEWMRQEKDKGRIEIFTLERKK